jgi:hypothetical protein
LFGLLVTGAVTEFREDVRSGKFTAAEQAFK